MESGKGTFSLKPLDIVTTAGSAGMCAAFANLARIQEV
jgi:hypothetical protein